MYLNTSHFSCLFAEVANPHFTTTTYKEELLLLKDSHAKITNIVILAELLKKKHEHINICKFRDIFSCLYVTRQVAAHQRQYRKMRQLLTA